MNDIQESFLQDLAELLSGLQVPLSLRVPLGAAEKPYRKILDTVNPFGWTDAEQIRAELDKIFGPSIAEEA